MVTGYKKVHGSKVHLKPFNGVIKGKQVKNGYLVKTTTSKTIFTKATTFEGKACTTITIGRQKVNKKLPHALKKGLNNDK